MASSSFDDLPNLQPENWAAIPIREREEVLQRLENKIARSQNRPECTVIDFYGPPEKVARLHPANSTLIEINQHWIFFNNPEMAVRGVIHEGRHSYQMDCVNNPIKHLETSKQTIETWAENILNYIPSKDGLRQYSSQSVEADANAFEELMMREVYPHKAQVFEKTTSAKEQGFEQDGDRTIRLAHWRNKSGMELPKVTKSPAILEHEHDRDPTD